MEAGFSRMNDVTVLQASQGLAAYIKSSTSNGSVVIGHDHRHNSERFAQLTAVAFISQNIKVYYLGHLDSTAYVHTPLVPFAIDLYGCSGGVMITASHNPAADNGYKVYWSNGCQIIPPHDSAIQNAILDNLDISSDCWETKPILKSARASGLLIECRELVLKKYVDTVIDKLVSSPMPDESVVYTPIHGVGKEPVLKVLEGCNYTKTLVVEQQAVPDADFSTVAFPNPEEKGALDMAMAKADSVGARLVIANDPDADRFSCATKEDGGWVQLSGNEIGLLFAEYVISKTENLSQTCLVNSTVSSQMIKQMAKVRGFHFEETLTGFKWIGNKAIELEGKGLHVPFAYEEALGYMFPVVHDKDGVAALVVFLQLYADLRSKGLTLLEKLHECFTKYGFFKQCNGYYTVPRLELTDEIFKTRIRKKWERLGPYVVDSWRDLTIGFDSSTLDHKPVFPVDPNSQMITAEVHSDTGSARFTVRGSGTEPKLKVYIEGHATEEKAANDIARGVWNTLQGLWFPKETGLRPSL